MLRSSLSCLAHSILLNVYVLCRPMFLNKLNDEYDDKYHYIQGGTRKRTLCFVLTDFHTYFTVRMRRTFVVILSLKIPQHLKCVATLPCEMCLNSNN